MAEEEQRRSGLPDHVLDAMGRALHRLVDIQGVNPESPGFQQLLQREFHMELHRGVEPSPPQKPEKPAHPMQSGSGC